MTKLGKLPIPEQWVNLKPESVSSHISWQRQRPQAQYSLDQQLNELMAIGNKYGLYDAVDLIRTTFTMVKK